MANLPDKPMSSVMLTRLKQFTAMSKFKVSAASCPQTACKPQLNIHRSFPSQVSPPPCSECHQFTNPSISPRPICSPCHICHLQVTLLNLVAKHLNPAEIGSLKESFLAMDEDGSGFLTVRDT